MTLKQRVLKEVAKLSRKTPRFRGKTRLQRLTQRALGEGEVTLEIGGIHWCLDLQELIQSRLFWDGTYGGAVLTWMLSEVRPGDVVWDVGANIGDMALFLAKRGEARVEAFEPSPAVYTRFINNLRMNPGLDVVPRAMGLSDHDGVVRFFASAESGNAGLGSLGHASNTVDEGVEVVIACGDSLIAAGEGVPRIIKMDIEGFESEALVGMRELLRGGKTLVCVESSGYRLRERGLPLDAIVSLLESFDFRVTVLKDGGEREVRPTDLAGNIDLVGRPR